MPNSIGNFLGLLGGIDSPASGLFNNMAAGVSPAQSQAQMARQQFQIGQQNFAAQVQGLISRGYPIDKAIAAVSDPNGPAAQDIYGPPKQYQGMEVNEQGVHFPGPLYGGGQFMNAPQFGAQTAAKQNAGGTNGPAATPGIGGSATAGVPPELQQAAPIMDYLHQQKAKQVAAEAMAKEQGQAAQSVDGDVAQVDRSIELIDKLMNHPGMKFATGLFANIPGGPPKNTQAYDFVKGVGQLKEQLVLGLIPTLGNRRVNPAFMDMLQKSTAGHELDLGVPNFPDKLQETRGTLTQIRAAIQQGAGVPVTEPPKAGGPPTFKTQADLRAAMKAGQIKVGQPFNTGDGRTLLAQ